MKSTKPNTPNLQKGSPPKGSRPMEQVMFPADGDFNKQVEEWLQSNPDYDEVPEKRADNSHLPKPYRVAVFIRKGTPKVIRGLSRRR